LDLNCVLASVGEEMVEKYNKYSGKVSNMNNLLYFGVILDPRFKMRIIGWKFMEMYVGRAQFGADLLESIETALTKLYNWYKQEYDKNSTQPSPMIVDHVVDTTMPTGRYSREKSEMSFDAHLTEERMVNSKNELQAYLTSPCEPKSVTLDLLIGGSVMRPYTSSYLLWPETFLLYQCQQWLLKVHSAQAVGLLKLLGAL
jgi:hypothetical protein